MKYKEIKERFKIIGFTVTKASPNIMFRYGVRFSDGIQKGNTLAVCKDIEE